MTEPKKTGRPSKRTPEVEAKILEALRGGNYLETAAAYAGITYETLRQWTKEFSEFSAAVEKARADAEVRNVGVVLAAAPKNWQAAAWWLERSFPKRYGRQDKVEVDHAKPIEVRLAFNPRPE